MTSLEERHEVMQLSTPPQAWAGDNPYFLLAVKEDSEHQKIDLDERGWATKYKGWTRGRMRWYLVRKADEAVIVGMEVHDGDKPWVYTHHSTVVMGPQAGAEWLAYGIGVDRGSGKRNRRIKGMWITQYGLVCNDVDLESMIRG